MDMNIECKCGKPLKSETGMSELGVTVIKVDPCPVCVKGVKNDIAKEVLGETGGYVPPESIRRPFSPRSLGKKYLFTGKGG